MKSFGPQREKTCFRGLRTNKGIDQPAHPCSLISALSLLFVVWKVSNLDTLPAKFQFSS